MPNKLRQNSPNLRVFLAQFHRWFDAFKTLKRCMPARQRFSASALVERRQDASEQAEQSPGISVADSGLIGAQTALLRHLRQLERQNPMTYGL